MYRALMTDLDATAVKLASDGKEVDQETKDAVTKAEKAGYHVASATGRDWATAKPVVIALGLKSLCVISGGSAIIDPTTEEIVWEKPLTPGTANKIFKIFKDNVPDSYYFYTPEYEDEVPLSSVSEVNDQQSIMYLNGVSVQQAEKVAGLINASGFAVAHNTPSWNGHNLLDVHVTHPEATKEHAIKIWHQMQGVTVQETIGMGDSGNDKPLFQAAGLKVAVGNATDEIKALADYIAPDCDDHALKHVIDKFLLSQRS